MHAFMQPFFQPPRIIIKLHRTGNAAMVETKSRCEFTDNDWYVKFLFATIS